MEIIEIDYSHSSCLVEEKEAEDFIEQYNAKIYSDKELERIQIGELHFSIYKIDESLGIVSLYDLFDTTIDDSSYLTAFFDIEMNAKDEIECLFEDGDIFILKQILLTKDYRGKGIGKRVINHLISKFSSSSRYFFLKPFPLQMCGSSILKTKLDKDEVDFNSLNKDENISSFKLKQFYSSIGFKEFNNLMVLDTLNIDS